MNVEIKRDMLAFQWCRRYDNYELMLSIEFGHWALPLAIEVSGYKGYAHDHVVQHRSYGLRILCGAVYFSHSYTAPAMESA